MAYCVKCLLCNHRDLSSDPNTCNLGEAVCTYNPSTGRWEQLDSEGLVARKSGSRLTQRTCFKNKAEPERGTVHL